MYTVQLTGLRAPTQIINSVKALRSYTSPRLCLKDSKDICDQLKADVPVTMTLDLNPHTRHELAGMGYFRLADYFEFRALGDEEPTVSLAAAKVALSAIRDHMMPCDLRNLAKSLPTSADTLNKAADLMEKVA